MDLYKEILVKVLAKEEVQVLFPSLNIDAEKIVKQESYRALKRIQEILEDDTLEDSECFQKIEEIVYLFEKMGSGCGVRHDFG